MRCQARETDDNSLGVKGVLKGKNSYTKVVAFSDVYTNPQMSITARWCFFSPGALSSWVVEMIRGAGTPTAQPLVQPPTAINNQGWDLMSFLHALSDN